MISLFWEFTNLQFDQLTLYSLPLLTLYKSHRLLPMPQRLGEKKENTHHINPNALSLPPLVHAATSHPTSNIEHR